MSPDVSDYGDAVERIVGADVPDGSTTQAEIESALRDSDSPQVTPKVAQDLADAVVTEGDVIEGLSQLGRVPTEGEIEAVAQAGDEYDLERASDVANSVRETVATMREIEEAVGQTASESEQIFREDIEQAVDGLDKHIVGESQDQVVQRNAEEQGAPRRSDVRRERAQAAAPDDAVTPADREDLSSDSNTPINIIEGSDGEPVGAVGGASQGGVSPEETAEELGVEYLGGIQEVAESVEISGSGSSVDLEIAGERVGEVEI
jgi:hypothetical protein